MYISRLELENIKSYGKATFDFAPGITAIRGDNGAGKTTIIEAVAWAMFDMLDYTKEQFVRRGEKKGSVRVTFVSGIDEREYEIFRDSGSTYFAKDPRLGAIIANKKEEVQRFVWQHLGLDPGTDLESLFRQAIGVPQGTFTAVFLSTTATRKAIFDKLLKVDEYRDAAARLLDTSRFVEHRISDTREQVARIEGELARSESVVAERESLSNETRVLAEKIGRIELDLDAARTDLAVGEKQHAQVAEMQAATVNAQAERERAELAASNARSLFEISENAVATIDASRPASERYQAAITDIKRLEKARSERDELQKQLNASATKVVAVETELRSVQDLLTRAEAAAREASELAPKAAEQEKFEGSIRNLRERLVSAKAVEAEIASLEERLQKLRDQFAANTAAIKQNEEKAAVAAELAELEKRSGELITSLAAVQASLERDERFQREIKNGLCPILSQKCLNLGPGETLESFVSSQFSSLRSQIGELTTERNAVDQRLAIAREGQKAAAEVASLRRRNEEIETEGKTLVARSASLKGQAASNTALADELASFEEKLAALADPRGRLRVLEKQAAEKNELTTRLAALDAESRNLNASKSEFELQLTPFAELDADLSAALARRDENADEHLKFLANEAAAAELEPRRIAYNAAAELFESAVREADRLLAAHKAALDAFDQKRFEDSRLLVAALDRSLAAETARYTTANERLEKLTAEIDRFADLRKTRDHGLAERERLEAVSKTTAFIRDTLKEAAPQIARNYVRHVAVEANQLFREITGNGERSLKWNDDYSVSVEEDSYERPFVSLSGGEQMSAALAVRLALLKQLTEIRIAFFDEPTTNMDEVRRENLAAEIRSITNFDQLFVISHDDTFDNYVDNVIVLGDGARTNLG
ncbi:MAG: SMC family ATPase [Acidobacteria bacterium]|nr:SMC family ATPase [Acidobacteriota bacterium]